MLNYKLVLGIAVAFMMCATCVSVLEMEPDDAEASFRFQRISTTSTACLVEANNVSGTVTIPNTYSVNGVLCDIVEIDDGVFKDKTELTRVNLPSKLTIIGDEAFSGCTKLATVTHLDKVDTIGSKAFKGCIALTSITIPNSTTYIGPEAFEGCEKLEMLKFGTGLTTASLLGPAFKDTRGADFTESAGSLSGHIFKGTYNSLKQQVCVKFDTKGGSHEEMLVGEYNTTLTLPTPTRDHYTFLGWYEDETCVTKFTGTKFPDEDIKLYANWQRIDVRSISLSMDSTIVCVNNASVINVITTPADAYISNLDYETDKDNIAFLTKVDNYQLKVTGWEPGTCKITVTANGDSQKRASINITVVEPHQIILSNNGHGTVQADTTSAGAGQKVTLTVTADPKYQFTTFESNPQISIPKVSEGKYSFTMVDSDVSIKAIFEESDFKITKDAGDHGTITGPDNISRGGRGVYSVKANDGYIVADMKLDGVSKGKDPVLVLTNVTAAHTISVTYEALSGAKSTVDASGNVTVTYPTLIDGQTVNVQKKYKTDGSVEVNADYKLDDSISVQGTVKKTGSSVTGTAYVKIIVSGNNVPSQQYEKAQRASADLKTISGFTDAVIAQGIELNCTTEAGESDGFSITVDMAKYDGSSIVGAVGDKGTIGLSAEALKEIVKSGTSVKLTLKYKPTDKLSPVQRWIAEDYTVYDVGVSASNKAVTEFAGQVALTLPYELAEGEVASDLKLYYIASKEAEAQEAQVYYDSYDKTAVVDITHASLYFLATDYIPPEGPMPSDSIAPYIFIPVVIILAILVVLFLFRFDLDNMRFDLNLGGSFGRNKDNQY